MRFKDPVKGEIPSDGEETLHYFLKTVSTVSATSQWTLLASIPCNFHLRNATRDRKIIRNKLLKDLVPNFRYHQTTTRQVTTDTYGNNLQPSQTVLAGNMIQLLVKTRQTL